MAIAFPGRDGSLLFREGLCDRSVVRCKAGTKHLDLEDGPQDDVVGVVDARAVQMFNAGIDEVRACCRMLWAEYAAVVGGRRMFATSHRLLKRAGLHELDERDEAERQHSEFTPYLAADAGVYSAADKAGVVPEFKGLLASRTAPVVQWRRCSAAGSDERTSSTHRATKWPCRYCNGLAKELHEHDLPAEVPASSAKT